MNTTGGVVAVAGGVEAPGATRARAGAGAPASGPVRAAASFARAIALGWRRRRALVSTTRALSRLDDRLLADIGIAREQIPMVAEDLVARAFGAHAPRAER